MQGLALDKLLENQLGVAADLSILSRIAEKQGRKDAALEYGERAYRGYQALGGNDRAMAELTRAIRLAKELGVLEKAQRLGAELMSEERRLGPPK